MFDIISRFIIYNICKFEISLSYHIIISDYLLYDLKIIIKISDIIIMIIVTRRVRGLDASNRRSSILMHHNYRDSCSFLLFLNNDIERNQYRISQTLCKSKIRIVRYCDTQTFQCFCELLARLNRPVTSPATKVCHRNNNASGYNGATALQIFWIVHRGSKNKYFPYLF